MAKNNDISLEYIREEKKRIKKLIGESQTRIKSTTSALIAKPEPNNKREQIAMLVGNAFTIFDGVMLGLKITRRVRSIFHK